VGVRQWADARRRSMPFADGRRVRRRACGRSGSERRGGLTRQSRRAVTMLMKGSVRSRWPASRRRLESACGSKGTDLRVTADPPHSLRHARIRYSGPGIAPIGTSASKITSTSIPISSAIATPRITNHTAGSNDQLPLCLAIELMIGEAHANAISPSIHARNVERRRPSNPDLGHRDEGEITLARVLQGPGDRLIYTYDFGDDWDHELMFEHEVPAEPGAVYPRCVAGKGACPPEDCRGPWGYGP
jgi:Plasmid pRiA4b ORF-3-like protein